MNIAIDVFSDVICPWCYIGKRRMEKAIAEVEDADEISIQWLPYQLNPSMPPDGVSRREYRTQKFGSWERSQQLDASVVEIGLAEGIQFAFDRIERTPNTVDAHRMIRLAEKQNCQDAVVEGLFRAYFVDGRDISNRQTLIDVVTEAGLERGSAEDLLESNRGMSALQDAQTFAQRLAVDGVPFFIVNHQITLAGAQEPAMFLQAFRHLSD